jgi:allantoinase
MVETAAMETPLLLHAELPGPLEAAERWLHDEDPCRYATFLASRPPEAEIEAVELVFALARRTRARAHVVHLSAAGALPLVARARREDVPLTVESCPHYLSFAAEEIPDGCPEHKCCPPIRQALNRELLWEALRHGLITQVVTDHSPADAGLKCMDSGDYMKAWGGIASLQLGLAATWTGARARGFGIPEVLRWMAEAPAALVGLAQRKGRIAPGFDADLVAWSPDAAFTVDPVGLFHRHPVTPYAGRRLQGTVRRTWLRGVCVYQDGLHLDRPQGNLLRSPA